MTVNATGAVNINDTSGVLAAATGDGSAGSIAVTTLDALTLSRGGRISSEAAGSGAAGSVSIQTDGALTVREGSQVTVSGTGSGAAGDIDISARSLLLSNQGKISAATASGEGGNIHITVNDSIVLRHNSEITTEARGPGNGGNMRLEAGDFIWAVLSENSDIVAMTVQGGGGNIFARAKGVFGFRQFRGRRTAESDFIASSEVGIGGTVTLDVRDFQPDASLSEQFAEAEIGQGCQPNRNAANGQLSRSRFIHTGRGGIPANPVQALGGNSVQVPWVEEEEGRGQRAEGRSRMTEDGSGRTERIVEARGWVQLANGDVLLTAQPAHVREQKMGLSLLPCQSSSRQYKVGTSK